MVMPWRFAAVLRVRARSAPVLHPKLERLTGLFLWQTGEGVIYLEPNLTLPPHSWYNANGAARLPGRKETMALGFSPLMLNKSKGGEIMSDFEIISVVVMIASLVLKAIQFGRNSNNRKK